MNNWSDCSIAGADTKAILMMERPQRRLELVKQAMNIAIGQSVSALSQINQHPGTHQHLSNLRDIKKNLLDSANVDPSTSDNRDVIFSGERPAKKFSLHIHRFCLCEKA